MQFRVKKRVSDEEAFASQLKRHQPLNRSMKQTAALDDIPVRSVSFPSESLHPPKACNFGHHSFSRRAPTCTDVPSAHGSFTASTIFSAASEATTSFTSVEESFAEPSTQDTYAPCTQEREALDECFDSFDAPSLDDYRIEWREYSCLACHYGPLDLTLCSCLDL